MHLRPITTSLIATVAAVGIMMESRQASAQACGNSYLELVEQRGQDLVFQVGQYVEVVEDGCSVWMDSPADSCGCWESTATWTDICVSPGSHIYSVYLDDGQPS